MHGVHSDGPPGLAEGIDGQGHEHAEFGTDGQAEGFRAMVVLDKPAVGGAHEVDGHTGRYLEGTEADGCGHQSRWMWLKSR